MGAVQPGKGLRGSTALPGALHHDPQWRAKHIMALESLGIAVLVY